VGEAGGRRAAHNERDGHRNGEAGHHDRAARGPCAAGGAAPGSAGGGPPHAGEETRPGTGLEAVPYAEASPRERLLAEALAYYADPATYFGIAMIGDPPHGDFFGDFEEEPIPGEPIWDKPGRRAREALRAAFRPTEEETPHVK
jgi:hypothetical protein